MPENQRWKFIIGGFITVVLVGWCFAYETVTRNYIAADGVCIYCHLEREYLHSARMPYTKPHPVELKEGDRISHCVDCHLPEGFWAATYTYTHFASITDLFGRFRDRSSERAGDWIPMSAARAYRVRDRLLEYDSAPCRTCHIESEIVPKRDRGKKAHADALENKETCIECHTNLVHRYVEERLAEADTGQDEEEFEDEFEDEFDDDLEDSDEEEEVL